MSGYRRIAVAAAVALLCAGTALLEAKAVDERIFLIQAEKVDQGIVGSLRRALPGTLPVPAAVTVESSRPLPPAAYDRDLGQYNAALVLAEIAKGYRLSLTIERAIILTEADLYLPGTGPVFSLTDPASGVAVVSLARLRAAAGGGTADDRTVQARALKESMRVLGLSRGLSDCAKKGCVMGPSPDLAAIDAKKESFCHDCNKRLRAKYGSTLFTMPSF